MILSQEDSHKVVGEIYKITNTVTNKIYIGQTRSHRLNHKKYRPFGYMGRFKDHMHEANSNKKNQSRYLNAALLKYGIESFTCELLLTCDIAELDEKEKQYILENNSKYPNGYNLTNGGKGFVDIEEKYICELPVHREKKERDTKHSDYTKNLISERLKEAFNDESYRINMMKNTQNQHLSKKFERFKTVKIDETNIDKYIYTIKSNKYGTYVRIKIDRVKTTFVGKFEIHNILIERARNFILNLIEWQRVQIAGNPLEPSLPLTNGNICEELG
jgi:hypothetical protein